MKMSFWTLAALVLALCAVAASAQDCRADIAQTLGSSWTVNGQAYSQWSVTITAGPKDVKSLTLSMSGDFDQVWEVNKDASGHYVLPDYVVQGGGIKAGKTHNFGYIIKQATRSTITVLSVNCDSAAPSASASPAAPSASASPAAPSASASPAAPSPSASSQPSSGSCALTTAQTARSAANGGQWKDTAYTYQIYDLAINNAGSKVVTDAQLTFTLGAGASFYQFWGLDRQDASQQTFKVPNYGGVQVGASQSAGYVIRTALANGSPVAPTVHVDSASCSGSNGQQPSPAASSSPAAPSPSTVVGSPQPSASASPAPSGTCSASVSIVVRSGSNWQDGSGFNQIYDITIKNTGSRAIRGGEATFGLGQGVSITQFWELNRKTANQFSIPTTYGPLQVGASQGAGIVATRAQAPIDTPTLTLDSVTCY